MLLAVVLLSSAGMTNSTQAATPQATLPALTKQVKIAVIMPSAKNDLAWSQSMFQALETVQKEFGGPSKVQLTVIENMFLVPDATANAQKFASQGFDIVIMHGTQYGASMFDVAAKFPMFSLAWGTVTNLGPARVRKITSPLEARPEKAVSSLVRWTQL